MRLKLRSFFIILSIFSFFIIIIISCTSSPSNTTVNASSDKNSIIACVELYREYAQEFDGKNYELSQEFEKLSDVNDGIANIYKRLENAKKYKSDLFSLNVPNELTKFYSLKIKEVDQGILLFELTIDYYKKGTSDIQELQTQQQKLYEYSQKSQNEILSVLKSNNLEYLMD